jgi:hypothetical protein
MAAPLGEGVIRRERRRRHDFNLKNDQKQDIAKRVCEMYAKDLQARSADRELRLQRYAKYRGWRAGSSGWPWEESSDQAVPDMMEASIRMQDTLHNAVMSARPVVTSRSLDKNPENQARQDAVDALHDTQFFVEQNGERVVEEAAESFCNDPAVTFFVPWVKTRREVSEKRIFPAIPEDELPESYFRNILKQKFPDHDLLTTGEDGWDWKISRESDERVVRFYTTRKGDVEMVVQSNPIVFDGPSPRVLSYDDVITPPGVANLDIPSPENPGGAPHVIMRERPTKDEIARLQRGDDGAEPFYDLMSKADVDKLKSVQESKLYKGKKEQDDILEGVSDQRADEGSHGHLTRLVCFDTYDIDGDGKTEDVVFWVLLETERLLRVRLLTEVYPGSRPERPFAEASFLPVGKRRAGISMLEMSEGLHDFMKETIDQMVDNGTLANLPWFTYRANSALNPETLRPGPGDGIPTSDPKNDIVMQRIGNEGQAFWLNLIGLIRQQAERLTLQGDLQAGRVPSGGSSALRTLGGIQTLLSQGEARPERILRRFFVAFRRVFRLMHRLNRFYLPKEKKFMAAGEILQPEQDPYFAVATSDVDVNMEFDFHANVLNSSRMALQQGLQALVQLYLSDFAVQMGITTQDTAYRLLRDIGEAFGQDTKNYLNVPTPTAETRQIDAAEAVLMLTRGIFPAGTPIEGAQAHLESLQEIESRDSFGAFPPEHISLLRLYMNQIGQLAQREAQMSQLAESAGGMGAPLAQRGRPPEQLPAGPQQPMVQGDELLDETLATAGGGAA